MMRQIQPLRFSPDKWIRWWLSTYPCYRSHPGVSFQGTKGFPASSTQDHRGPAPTHRRGRSAAPPATDTPLQPRHREERASGDRHHAQWVTLWSDPGVAQIFVRIIPWQLPERGGGERREEERHRAGFSGRLYHLLRRFLLQTLHPPHEITEGLVRLASGSAHYNFSFTSWVNAAFHSQERERKWNWSVTRDHIPLPLFINFIFISSLGPLNEKGGCVNVCSSTQIALGCC